MQKLGAGEILITSVDHEGLQRGMDLKLLNTIKNKSKIPLIFSGGIGNINHIKEVIKDVDAIAIANCLHYDKLNISEIKDYFNIKSHLVN